MRNRGKVPGVAGTAVLIMVIAPFAWSQGQAGTPPQFEVASVKPNNGCENQPGPRVRNFSPSPGRLEMPCVTLQSLIQAAFGTFGDGVGINPQPLPMEGGPSWMRSEYYSVSAKAAGPERTEMLAGPMLQGLLGERFQLKTHRENRETPVYALTVGKGGLKVQALAEGACTPIDLSDLPPPVKPGDPPPNLCGVMIIQTSPKGDLTIEVRGSTMAQLAQRLSGRVDREVVDKTGIAGKYNFRLEYAPDLSTPGQVAPGGHAEDPVSAGAARDPAPDIFVAVQEQIGVKLSPDKGSVSFLIIDHVERPAPN
jgi:uncharacterized protein (TIGR03435 family)